MATAILQLAELANNQVNHDLTVNENMDSLEKATQNYYVVDLAAADVTIALADFVRSFLFRAANNAVARVFIVPQSKRFFAVHNSGSATLTVRRGTTDLTLAASASAFYYTDGAANGLIKIG